MIEENLPPNLLVISFDHSVVPIELVGKVATDGITVMPKIIGEWKWSAENELTFQPKADWPVGENIWLALVIKPLRLKLYWIAWS